MQRLAVLVPAVAAAAAVAVPTAGAGTFKGIVVGRDAARHTIAVASKTGVVRTVRTSRLRAAGTRVAVTAAKLPDLTFRASRVGAVGRARAARVHGVVLRHLPARTLVSAGGSVLSIATTGKTFAAANRLRPGTVVNANVKIANGRLSSPKLIQAGQATVFEAEGTIASLSPLTLTVEHGVAITLTVPAALQLPTGLAVGDRVEAIVQFDGTSYTLVTLTVEDANGQGNPGGVGEQGGEVEAEGTVANVTDTSITVQPKDDDEQKGSSPVTFAVPAGFDLHGVKQNDRVEAKGQMVNGVLTLTKLEVKGGDQSDDNGGNGSGDDGDHHDGGGSGSGGGDDGNGGGGDG